MINDFHIFHFLPIFKISITGKFLPDKKRYGELGLAARGELGGLLCGGGTGGLSSASHLASVSQIDVRALLI